MAAIGFSMHTGWAEVAAVADGVDGPQVLLKRRITLCDEALPRQCYHAVAEQGADPEVIKLVEASARDMAWMELEDVLGTLGSAGVVVEATAVARGSIPVPPLEQVLKSHMMLHHAEGQLFCEAVAETAASCGMRVVRFEAKGVYSALGEALGCAADEAMSRVAALGVRAGRPWAKDQKQAAAAAWLALAGPA
jgi:hypothetical protein